MHKSMSLCFGLIMSATVALETAADQLSIGTWNIEGAGGLENRDTSLAALGRFMSGVDFLVLQETLSVGQVRAFMKKSGLTGWKQAVSDFADDAKTNPYHKLEVAVVSPHPITAVREADPVADDDSPSARAKDVGVSVPAYIPAWQRGNRGSRGWLWVEFGSINTVVAAVHLKSSGGKSGRKDERNSFKREAIAAALIEAIKVHRKKNNGWSYVVAGDFNVAPGDADKIGFDLNHKCTQGRCFGYDQTHALFGGGLVRGFVMRNLVEGLAASYAKGAFVSSPIDNIYAMGPRFDKTTRLLAERGKAFGSDHFAIRVTVWSD